MFALLDHLDIQRVKAIGLSMGAKTLLHMATLRPDRVDAMVLDWIGSPDFDALLVATARGHFRNAHEG